MPHPVTLAHEHVVHVYGNPDIAGGIGNLVVNGIIDDEIVGFQVTILDIVYSRGVDWGKVKFHIVILVIITPRANWAAEHLGSLALFVDLI